MHQVVIIPERVAQITVLEHGSHDSFSRGACIMEAASYIAGEPWSDHPECVSPVIAAFARVWNDNLPDADRTRLLLPLLPKMIGTRGSDELEERRSMMTADWLIRVHTPAWLKLAGLDAHADALAALPEITGMASFPPTRPALEAAQKDAAAAWDAAWDAAGDAAWDAAGAAAWDAAGAAARAAARAAAWDAARAAAGAAAWDAARAAARAAAGKKLAPTVEQLQVSAVDLIERMCALTDKAA